MLKLVTRCKIESRKSTVQSMGYAQGLRGILFIDLNILLFFDKFLPDAVKLLVNWDGFFLLSSGELTQVSLTSANTPAKLKVLAWSRLLIVGLNVALRGPGSCPRSHYLLNISIQIHYFLILKGVFSS